MTHATVQTAALAVLRKLSEFDTSNSVENDYRILANGKAYHAILRRGSSDNRSMQDVPANGVYQKRSDRQVIIEIYCLYSVDSLTTRVQLNTITQTVLDHFDKWPNLGQTAGVIETDADNTSRPEDTLVGGSNYLTQQIELNVIELEVVTLA
tara:strand:- start:776 stop:1231 length:456 start_codon:yes stop_codon:yes gene_type:complete